MEWYELLPQDLIASAYRANEEMAWPRSNAIRVVDLLKSNNYVILGVDVWLPTLPGPTIPTPFVYDWTLRADVPSPDYARSAEEFVRAFAWHPSDTSHKGMAPYFNITARRRES